MPEVTSNLPLQLARINLVCEDEEDIQFTAKISLNSAGYAAQTMEELIKDVYHAIYPNQLDAVVKVISVSTDWVDTPDNPLIQVPIQCLRDTALDYAVAEALEWVNPLNELETLKFVDDAVFVGDGDGHHFVPSACNSHAAFFINKHQLSVEWNYPGNGTNAGPKYARVGDHGQPAHISGMLGKTLPEAVARHIVQSHTPRAYVSIPHSLLKYIEQ